MKKRTVMVTVALSFFSTLLFTSCSSKAEDVKDAQEEVNQSKEDLDEANKEYLEEMERYRLESAEKTARNKESIAEFQKRIDLQKANAKADYKKRIAELEQRNTDLMKEMNDYKEAGKDNWDKFKTDYNQAMDELALKLLELNESMK